MHIKQKLFIAKAVLVAAAVPIVIQAYEYGPIPRRTGAPGDAGTCLGAGCHSGSALNGGPGTLKIILPNNATTYTPGVKQHIQVQIADSSKQKFGFQMTARLVSDLVSGQAGSFSPSDGRTFVQCEDGADPPCSQFPVQFIEHNISGFNASTPGSFTYEFDWTPPSTNAGDVRLYAAAVAGPSGIPRSDNANVYTTSVTLTPSATGGGGPTIDTGGIVPVYSSSTAISSGTWVSIYSFGAKNLAAGVQQWNGDFPTNLGGVTVTFDNKPGYLWFVSPQQINVQVPDGIGTGAVPVSVTNTNGTTNTTVTVGQTSPSFLLLADAKHPAGFVYNAAGVQTLLGPNGSPGGARPAKKGEIVAIYGTGFGPTNPAVPSGQLFNGAANLIAKPTITVGGVAVDVAFGGLVGAGLYQFNFTIPGNIGSGDQAVVATAGGLQTPAGVSIPVE